MDRTAEPEVQLDLPVAAERRAGLVAGTALLLMSVAAGFGNFVAVQGLVSPGDAARTAADISASEGLFRFGVASWLLVAGLDVLVAWALVRFFRPVNRDLAVLAGWLRLAYAAVLMVAVGQLAVVPDLLAAGPGAGLDASQRAAQALVQVAQFQHIWDAGLVLFGLHLLLIGYLAHQSRHVPRLLGLLLVVAGAGYLVDGFLAVLAPGTFAVSTVTFVGEFLLAVWLVVQGLPRATPA